MAAAERCDLVERYKLLLNIIAQILSIYNVLLSLFCDISVLSRIQIPSGAVLPTSLLRKETRKVTRQFHCLKAKNRGWRGLNDRSNPCFSSIFLYWGLFCPEKHEKNLSCLGRQKRFLSWCARRDLNPYVINTRPSNVPVCQFQHSRSTICIIA